MEKSYRTILLGATMWALGYAEQNPDALVLENAAFPAPEYTLSLRPFETTCAGLTGGMISFFKNNAYLEGNDTFNPRMLLPYVCKYLSAQKIHLRFLCDVLSVSISEPGVCRVEFYDSEGIHAVYAEHVIDTRVPLRESKSFHLICHQPPAGLAEKLQAAVPEDIRISVKECAVDTCISFVVPKAYTEQKARQMVYDCWKTAFPRGEAKISMEGFCFDYGDDGRFDRKPVC